MIGKRNIKGITKMSDHNSIHKEGKITALKAFFLVSLLGYGVTLLRLFFSHGECFGEIFDASGYNAFMDMIMHLVFVNNPGQVYFSNPMACFPPFAYIFYLFINRVLPIYGEVTLNDYRQNPYFLLFYIGFIVICCLVLSEEICAQIKDKTKHVFAFILVIILSEPFLAGVIERGNSVFIALLLLIPALWWKDSDKGYHKELALIFIAMAAGLKIYPAIFGVLYLIEKRYKEAMRLTAYGILIMFVPFVFFGGIAGFSQFLYNLTQVKNVGGNLHTIQNAIFLLNQKVIGEELVSDQLYNASLMVAIFVGLLFMFFAIISHKKWMRYLFLTVIMVIVVPSSYPYTTIYLLIPFLYFVMEADQSKKDIICGCLWGGIFTMAAFPFPFFTRFFQASYCFESRYLFLTIMLILAMVEESCFFIANKGENKQ